MLKHLDLTLTSFKKHPDYTNYLQYLGEYYLGEIIDKLNSYQTHYLISYFFSKIKHYCNDYKEMDLILDKIFFSRNRFDIYITESIEYLNIQDKHRVNELDNKTSKIFFTIIDYWCKHSYGYLYSIWLKYAELTDPENKEYLFLEIIQIAESLHTTTNFINNLKTDFTSIVDIAILLDYLQEKGENIFISDYLNIPPGPVQVSSIEEIIQYQWIIDYLQRLYGGVKPNQ